jgi:hypothetical protein
VESGPQPPAIQGFRDFLRAPEPLPEAPRQRFLWALAQPLWGLGYLLRTPALRWRAILPAFLVTTFCVWVAASEAGAELGRIEAFYAGLAAIAPVPPVILAGHYARLAATVHESLGFGPAVADRKSLLQSAWEAILQLITLAVGIAPWVLMAESLPRVGAALGAVLAAVWSLHWIVVEAYDGGRVLTGGRTREEIERDTACLPPSWIERLYLWPERIPAFLRRPVSAFGRLVTRVTRPWKAEILLAQREPALAIGFGLATAFLLAVPGLNLLFRPAVIVAATHARARFAGAGLELVPAAAGTLPP